MMMALMISALYGGGRDPGGCFHYQLLSDSYQRIFAIPIPECVEAAWDAFCCPFKECVEDESVKVPLHYMDTLLASLHMLV